MPLTFTQEDFLVVVKFNFISCYFFIQLSVKCKDNVGMAKNLKNEFKIEI